MYHINLYVKFIRNPSLSNDQRYKKYKNKLTSILRLCEKDYFSKLIEEKKNDVKGTWRILNDIIRKKSCACDFPDTFVDENRIVTDTYEIANGFNRFFINVGLSLAANVPLCEGNICDYLGENQANSMYLRPISDSKVLML